MKLTKKLLSMLLVLCMVLSMLPTIALTASAADSSATWTKVTDAATLSSGDVIILACEVQNAYAGAMGTAKYFASADSIADAIEITLGGSAGKWTLTTSEGTIGTNAAKALNKTGSGTTTWKISISGGNATIQSTDSSYGSILYNATSPRFLNYTSGQTAIQIYKKTATAPSYTITAVSNNTAYGTVELRGSTITATPKTGYEVTGYTVTSGAATVTRNVNVFTVEPTSDCTVQINFAALPTYTLTLNENGTTSTSPNYAGAAVPLPPAENVGDYTFLGWSASATVSDEPADLMEAGKSYTMPAADTTLYAVYAKVTEGTGTADAYELVTAEKSDWSGTYVIADKNNAYVLDYATSTTAGNAAALGSTGITLSGNTMTNVAEKYTVTIGKTGNNYYVKLNGATSDSYLQLSANDNTVGKGTSYSTNAGQWTISWDGGVHLFSVNYATRELQKNSGYAYFRCYTGTQTDIVLYGQSGSGATYSDWTTAPSGTVTPTYTLTYDANTTDAVTGLPEAVSGITEGTDYTLSDATPVRYGYDFCGWAASAASEDEITSVTVNSDVTVYAIWLEKDKYTVSYYDSDNGTAIATKEYYDGETIAAADVPPNYQKPEGFTFKGWYGATYDDKTAPTYVIPAGTVVTSDLTFRAVYEEAGEGGGIVYKLVDTFTAGKNYIIATSNIPGTAYALDSDNLTTTSVKNITATEVTVSNSGSDIIISDADASILWTITGTASSAVIQSTDTTGYYLKINGSGIAGSDTSSTVYWSTTGGLYGKSGSGKTSYFAQPSESNINFSSESASATSRVYLYEESGSVTIEGYTTNPVPATTYAVKYYSNSTTVLVDKSYKEGAAIAAADVPAVSTTVTNHTFIGWATAPVSSTTFAPTLVDPSTYTVTGNLSFYAVYAEHTQSYEDTFYLQLKDQVNPYIFVGEKLNSYGYASAVNSITDAKIFGLEYNDGNCDLYYLNDDGTKEYVYYDTEEAKLVFSETPLDPYHWEKVEEGTDGAFRLRATNTADGYLGYGEESFRIYPKNGYANVFYPAAIKDYKTDPVEPDSYTITWISEGTTFTTTTVKENYTITAPATDPTKADDETNHKYYTFAGWAASEGGAVLTDFGTATEDKTFYAVFTEGTYATVNWDIDGATETEYYKDGETPTHATPSKESDGTYSYTFSGWEPTPTAVTAGETYTYTAQFTQTEIRYVASLVLNPAAVRVGKTSTAVGKLSFGDTEVTDYAPVYTSSETAVATVDASTGAISALAVGTTDITVTYTVNGNTYTATQTLTVTQGTSGGYTLMTKANTTDNNPDFDWSGDYIFMGRWNGFLADLNNYMVMTPYWIDDSTAVVEDGDSNEVFGGKTTARFNASMVELTIDGDTATGTIADEYSYGCGIEMDSTGLNDYVADDGTEYPVFDRITSIDDRFAFVIELVDDIKGYYTIRIKGTSYYLANTNTKSSGDNGMQYTLDATTDTKALWTISWAETVQVNDGYAPDVLMITSVYGKENNVNRSILLNSGYNNIDSALTENSRFRVYGDGTYSDKLAKGGDIDESTGQTYSLYIFGNPNPFNAQIYYQGDQKTIANPVELPQGMTAAADLESALTPDIADYPNWTLVGDAVWTLSDDSSGVMSLDAATGRLLLNSAEQGDYAIVTVTYTVHDNINNKDYSIATQAKVVVTASLETYTTIIYETESGKNTEVQYTVNAGVASLPLDYYVVNDMTGENSKTGTVVEGGTPAWSATSTNGNPVTITDGVLDLSQVNGKDIIQITLEGVKGNNVNASQATYKVYVITTPKLVADTATITDNTTPISIDVLANDQNLPEDAEIYGLGKTTADIAASSVTENVTIGTFGSVSVVDGKVQYTPSTGVSDGDQVVFYYAVQDTDGTLYYAKVTVTADITNESPDVEPGDVIYNLVTKEIVPDPDSYNFTGDYVFMGRKSGKMVDLNQFQILTPDWSGDSVCIEENGTAAANNASFVLLGDITDKVATGTIPTAYTSGATVSGSYIRMETTGNYDFTDANGTDRTILDRITYINEGFVLTIELVDDVHLYYTIRVKGTNYYLANKNTAASGDNGMEFTNSSSLDDTTMLWKIRWATDEDGLQTTDGYTPDQILIESVAALNVTELSADDDGKATLPLSRAILFNNHGWGATNIAEGARFRVYGERAYAEKLDSDDYGSGLCYNLFLYGAPVPFTAQILQDGEVKTVADPVTVSAGRTADVDLESLLLPDIDTEPNYALEGEPVWVISGNSATANGAAIQLTDVNEGTFNIGSATEGAYAYVTVTYTVYDKVNDSTHKVSTDARIVITAAAQSFNGVLYTGSDTAPNTVSKNIVTGTPVELDYYVVDNMTSLTSLDAACGFTVNHELDVELLWEAVDTEGNEYDVNYDPDTGKWTVDTTGAAAGEIITVTMVGAQAKLDGNLDYSEIANAPSFKIYVVDTLQLVADEATLSDLNALTIDVLANDLNLYEGAVIHGLGLTAADIATNAQTANVAIGTYGTVSVDASNHVIFTPSASVKEGDVITFYYSVLGEDGSDYYAKVTITVDGLTAEGNLTTDSLVIDFGIPVTFSPTANDTGDFANAAVTGLKATADGAAASPLSLSEGNAVLNADGTVTFTPTKIMTAPAVFYYTVQYKEEVFTGTVQIIPATNVYYEDSLGDEVFSFAPTTAWATIGTTDESAQQRADFVGDISSNVYGYDEAYAGFATYSLGSAHVATVNGTTTLATVDFDFYGTGFDVVSMTGGNTGYLIVAITDAAKPTEVLYRYVVDTYYGFVYSEAGEQVYNDKGEAVYTYEDVGQGNGEYVLSSGLEVPEGAEVWDSLNGVVYYYEYVGDGNGNYAKVPLLQHWIPNADASQDFYQIPVMKINNLEPDLYHVSIAAYYSKFYDHAEDGSYQFIFDAVRIYDPCGNDATAEAAYITDGENDAHYLNLRDELIKGKESESVDTSESTTESEEPTVSYTASFTVPYGASAPADISGETITLPAAVAAPTNYDAYSYSFLGWATAEAENATSAPTYYAAGAEVTLTEDTDFYAVYTYTTGTSTGTSYILVTDESQLTANAKVVIASADADSGEYYAMGAQGNNNRGAVVVTKNGSTVVIADGVTEFTLVDNGDGTYAFYDDGTGYLYAAATGSNHLKTQANVDVNASWTIDVTNATTGAATVVAAGSNNRNEMMYNNSSNLFSCYAANNLQKNVALYQKGGAATYYTTVLATAEDKPDVYVASLDPSSLTMNIDDIEEVTPSLSNNGEAVTDYEVSYSSDNEDAIYAEAGEILALDAGTATVTATFTVGGTVVATASCYVTVNAVTFRATFTGADEAHLPAAIEGTTITLPDMGAPGYTVDGVTYTFLGWVEADVDNVSEEPEYETAGTPVTLTADKNYIALYSYTTGGSDGSTVSGYKKVTAAPSDWSGEYLIVCENDNDNVAFNGGLTTLDAVSNTVSVTISNDTIASNSTVDAATFTIAQSGSDYTIQSSSGYYVGQTSDANGLKSSKTTTYANTLSMNNDQTVNIVSSGAYMRYNNDSGQYRFRYYKSTSYTGQEAITLYKKEAGSGSGSEVVHTYTTVIETSVTYVATVQADTANLNVGGTAALTSVLSANGVDTVDFASVTWTSSNTAAVSIVSDGESCTATAEAVGSSTITVTYVIDGITKKAEVTIVVSAANDGTQPDSYSTTYNSGTRGVTCTSLSGTNADGYYTGSYTYSELSQQTAVNLLSSLRSLTTSNHSTTTSYNNCRDNAYRTDCQEEDQTVVLLYTGYVADQDDFNGSAPGWNREHVWPQSLGGFGTSGAGSDMHHIRPDDVTTNGDRGNKRFGNVSGGTESLASSLCGGMLGGWYDNSYFEPLDSVKGDVARICLYVYVRYGSTYSECSDITNVFKDTDTLLQWMAMDPVDTWEMGRNVVVENIQGNRNPFIDYPELAWQLFGQEAPDGYATPSGSLLACTHSNTTSSTVAATCTTDGSVTVTCSDCGETISTETIAATGHINTTSSTVAATCTTAGSVTVTCSDCGETISTETIAATGHSYTYTSGNKTHTGTCSGCGNTVSASHSYVNKACVCGAETMSIYFQNNWQWSDIKLYYWYEDGSYDNAWPGKAMTRYGKNTDTSNPYDIYTMEVPSHVKGIVISSSSDQSPDITSGWYDGICYYMYWEDGNKVGSYNIGDATINTSAVSAEVLPYDLSNTAPVRGASTASVETESSAPATRETTVEEGTANGLVFIDGNEAASLEEYEAYGPNNEIYLARNQAVAFNLSFNTAPKTIQIGLKSVEGDDTADKASYFVVSCGGLNRTFKITTATEMYYDITDLVTIGVTEKGTYASAYPIIITKTNGDLGSLTYLKWTSVASNTVTKANASTFLEDEDLTDILDKVDEIVGNTDPDEAPVPPAVDEDEGPIMPPDEDEGPIMPPDEDNDPVEDETPDDPVEPPVEDETPVADVEKFTDLDKNSWYYEGVAYAVAKGLMNGMSETQFMPDETLTRAMLVTILYRQAGSPAVGDTELAFTDVAENVWYYDAVAWAYENGITTGVTATEFAPDLPVTRQQMVTFLWRAAGEPEAVKGYGDNAPADAATVAAYAAEAMAWAYENEIIKGEDGLLKPENNATRAQIANIFMRYEKSLALASEM